MPDECGGLIAAPAPNDQAPRCSRDNAAPNSAIIAGGIVQPCSNLGVRLSGLEGLLDGVSFTGVSVAAAGVSTSKMALQPSLSESRCRSMQAVMRSTLGISELQSRMASPEHISCCSSV